MVSRFWLSEEIDVGPSFSPEEARCEEIFKQDVQRSEDGRYVVSLPKNESVFQRLGESKRIAIDRLKGTERRLARNPALHEEYHKFMNEYIELGHMQKVEERDSKKRCFLPHHPVLKEASTTTKVRVVFDASCKTSSGISLNDTLLLGPTIQQDLRSIILRSRTKQILIVSDVEKMFRQVYVRKEDRPLQCILWRSSPEKEIDVYEMNTVTYGTKPAPFLATRALKQLAMDEKEHYSRAAQVLQTDVYMDDVITGADSKEEAIMLRQELDAIMKSGGFLLRKWASNCPEVLDGISEENLAIKESEEILLDPDPSVTTLGLVWRPKSDILKLKFQIPRLELTEQLTKRKILSVIASLFDPLGLVGAAITTAKIFLQLLWTYEDSNGKKLDWDSPLPKMVGEEWWKFYKQLPLLQEISIGRCLIIPKAVSVEIHCFSDASVKAFGTCAYVKSKNAEGSVWIRLVSSKSKVAPLKCQSIPRLELCGALMAAQLYQKLAESLQLSCNVHFWTDSSCVLRWLESTPTTWTTYVANRVSKIQIITEDHTWSHVAGIDNPADIISRGIYPESLLDSSLWWHGPSWLVMDSEFWPKPVVPLSSDVEKERCRKIVANVAAPFAEFNIWYISKHATYTELIRRTAYYLRVMVMLKLPKEKRKGSEFLTTAELRHAEYILISRVQRETFPNEWKALSSGQVVACKSPLRWFNPYISPEDGIMRIGGRLNRSQELSDTKHQIILPAKHLFTRKLLEHYHEKLMHAGPQLMLAVIRLKYWPLGGRNLIRLVVHQCVRCFRLKPRLVQQQMGDLPPARVTPSRAFCKTGIDYFGPVLIRPGPRRVAVKAYVAVFVCMAVKAVHLELVSDLSTGRFLQALRRFFGRRGKCQEIFSDNGTNFVGAKNYLQDLRHLLQNKDFQEKVSKECANDGIKWHFNPPSGPHFGGLWESAVRSAKQHLFKVMKETALSIEDMTTLLVQVEACLNSRPLTKMSDDPDDLEPLTPAHFLIGSSLQSIPEEELLKIPFNRLDAVQSVQKSLQSFWKRWKTEYLNQLQGRTKRWRPAVSIDVGRLVVIHEDHLPPLKWKMGRIHEVHPGEDEIVRVVTLKTEKGFLKRPVEKICLLPISESNESE